MRSCQRLRSLLNEGNPIFLQVSYSPLHSLGTESARYVMSSSPLISAHYHTPDSVNPSCLVSAQQTQNHSFHSMKSLVFTLHFISVICISLIHLFLLPCSHPSYWGQSTCDSEPLNRWPLVARPRGSCWLATLLGHRRFMREVTTAAQLHKRI